MQSRCLLSFFSVLQYNSSTTSYLPKKSADAGYDLVRCWISVGLSSFPQWNALRCSRKRWFFSRSWRTSVEVLPSTHLTWRSTWLSSNFLKPLTKASMWKMVFRGSILYHYVRSVFYKLVTEMKEFWICNTQISPSFEITYARCLRSQHMAYHVHFRDEVLPQNFSSLSLRQTQETLMISFSTNAWITWG